MMIKFPPAPGIALVLSLCLPAGTLAQQNPGNGDTLIIPVGRQGDDRAAIEVPAKGLGRDAVVAQFGEPDTRSAPSGDPPISRWQYPQFVVYFEGDTVIHSVVKHRTETGSAPPSR